MNRKSLMFFIAISLIFSCIFCQCSVIKDVKTVSNYESLAEIFKIIHNNGQKLYDSGKIIQIDYDSLKDKYNQARYYYIISGDVLASALDETDEAKREEFLLDYVDKSEILAEKMADLIRFYTEKIGGKL